MKNIYLYFSSTFSNTVLQLIFWIDLKLMVSVYPEHIAVLWTGPGFECEGVEPELSYPPRTQSSASSFLLLPRRTGEVGRDSLQLIMNSFCHFMLTNSEERLL